MEIHLDLIGGMAGDMFIAALLDAWPQHEARVHEAIDVTRGTLPVSCALVPHQDSVLSGRRFKVWLPATPQCDVPLPMRSGHEHVAWSAIRTRLIQAPLPERVRRHAIGIFELLADAEAQVHGVEPQSVQFHEVGAWDSIADVVGAATLIDALGATRWSTSAVPLGGGRVATAHGTLPVPTPATARLLLGMPTVDDGVAGERITPTGAAILRHLSPPHSGTATRRHAVRSLIATGTGFGSRTMPGLSNHLRALCFEPADVSEAPSYANGGRLPAVRRLDVIEFEIDDQSGEDLATGLDRLRQREGVLDVTQSPVFGKKGRMTVHLRVLVRSDRLQAVVAACFEETTTIGLRYHPVEAVGLDRQIREAHVDGRDVRVKVVDRLGRLSAKTESDDVLMHATHQCRAEVRRRAELQVLSGASETVPLSETTDA